MIAQGLTLTIIGMAIVFIFLLLLVFVMRILSGLVRKFEERSKQKSAEVEVSSPEAATVVSEEEETVQAGEEDYSEIAAVLGAYLRDGGILPAVDGYEKEDIAAVMAALSAAGASLPQASQQEIAAALASVYTHRNS